MNPWRFHRVPFPDVSPYEAAFAALIARTPEGGAADYDLAPPKWWFLHHLTRHGFVLHGSNNGAIDEFELRGNYDAHNVRRVEGIFASDDAIWPLYFATADRHGGRRGLINWCEHVGDEARYLFALEGDPSWTNGTVYALPGETFEPTPGSRELVSFVQLRPRLRVPVTPDDFPLRSRTIGFRRGESVRRVAIRHALRLRR
ncbi:MAG: hypothetical protein ACXVQQ_03195 [Gaiellaceae bacterium]